MCKMSDLGTYAGTKTMEIVGPIFEIAKMIFAPRSEERRVGKECA